MLRMSETASVNEQAMQHMLTSQCVDWSGLTRAVANEVDELLGGEQSVLLIDESAMAKKGKASAGVARQWNGRLGKVDNSQVGVYAALCRDEMACLFSARLYLPKSWVADVRGCDRAAIPETERVYRSKSALALEMIDEADRHAVRYGFIAIDGGYGKEPAFLRALDARGKHFVADVHKDQHVYVTDPQPQVPRTTGRGCRPTHPVSQASPIRVDAWAAAQPASAWKQLALREGEKGEIRAEYLHARVWLWDGKEEKAHPWHLMIRREVSATAPSHYCLSNAPQDTALAVMARVQAQRFFIEHAFREAKSECAMADYQVRRWDAWHHHMALVMLAALFLVKQKRTHRQTWPMLSLSDMVTAIAHMLPKRQMSATELAGVIERRHQLRKAAKESHRRRQPASHSPHPSSTAPGAAGI